MANAERQKIQLETKNLMKLKVSQQEMEATKPQINSERAEHRLPTNYVQQRVQTRASGSSGGNRKKAADFYF